jgi:acyl carrier protein
MDQLELSGTERTLTTVLKQVLRGCDVEPTANWFVLGMHSMLVMQFAARVERAFGVKLPLQEYFDKPTVTELATVLDARLHLNGGDRRLD